MKSLVLNNEDSIYDLWLSRITGVGIVTFQSLVKQFGTSKNLFFSTEVEVKAIKNTTVAESILSSRRKKILKELQDELNDLDIQYLSYKDKLYPKNLLKISDYPPILYLKGKQKLLESIDFDKSISVVGARKFDSYGKSVCEKFVLGLVQQNYTVVSGMAFGIDKLAHVTTLENQGITIAVLGSGVDVVSPESNRSTYERLLEEGLIVSELPPGFQPNKFTFPQRNRIIAGLTKGTLIIQAGEKSGSLITASFALEQGREVFAVPDNIFKQTGKGTNNLIKCSGAKLVQEVDDILEELTPNYQREQLVEEKVNALVGSIEKKLYKAIAHYEGIYFDQLVEILDKFDEAELLQVLSELELESLISRGEDGRYYIKV